MKSFSRSSVSARVGVEPEDDAGGHLHPVIELSVLIALQHRQRSVLLLAHLLERIGFRRLDADEHRLEFRLSHQRQNFRLLGEIERRLAGEVQRMAAFLLPFDQMRQHFARRLAVADEIVVDEID